MLEDDASPPLTRLPTRALVLVASTVTTHTGTQTGRQNRHTGRQADGQCREPGRQSNDAERQTIETDTDHT